MKIELASALDRNAKYPLMHNLYVQQRPSVLLKTLTSFHLICIKQICKSENVTGVHTCAEDVLLAAEL